jgi:hypothetical protein
MNQDEKINPIHYNQYEYPPLDFIIDIMESHSRYYILGNVIKYISRYKKKDGVVDLKKALFYLNLIEGKIPRIKKGQIQRFVSQLQHEDACILSLVFSNEIESAKDSLRDLIKEYDK